MEILDDYISAILHSLDEGLAITDTTFNTVYNNKILNNILEIPVNKDANVFDFVSDDDMAVIKTLLSQTSGKKSEHRRQSDIRIRQQKGSEAQYFFFL